MDLNLRTVAASLPMRVRWLLAGTPLDSDFSAAHNGFRMIPREAIGDELAFAAEMLVFGEQDFAEGGGATVLLCVCRTDGRVYGFDPEREVPVFLFNSSLKQFVESFDLLNGYLAQAEPLPSDCESRLRAIDPEAHPDSDWRLLVKCLRTAAPEQ